MSYLLQSSITLTIILVKTTNTTLFMLAKTCENQWSSLSNKGVCHKGEYYVGWQVRVEGAVDMISPWRWKFSTPGLCSELEFWLRGCIFCSRQRERKHDILMESESNTMLIFPWDDLTQICSSCLFSCLLSKVIQCSHSGKNKYIGTFQSIVHSSLVMNNSFEETVLGP
jgi:hypothetical protein